MNSVQKFFRIVEKKRHIGVSEEGLPRACLAVSMALVLAVVIKRTAVKKMVNSGSYYDL